MTKDKRSDSDDGRMTKADVKAMQKFLKTQRKLKDMSSDSDSSDSEVEKKRKGDRKDMKKDKKDRKKDGKEKYKEFEKKEKKCKKDDKKLNKIKFSCHDDHQSESDNDNDDDNESEFKIIQISLPKKTTIAHQQKFSSDTTVSPTITIDATSPIDTFTQTPPTPANVLTQTNNDKKFDTKFDKKEKRSKRCDGKSFGAGKINIGSDLLKVTIDNEKKKILKIGSLQTQTTPRHSNEELLDVYCGKKLFTFDQMCGIQEEEGDLGVENDEEKSNEKSNEKKFKKDYKKNKYNNDECVKRKRYKLTKADKGALKRLHEERKDMLKIIEKISQNKKKIGKKNKKGDKDGKKSKKDGKKKKCDKKDKKKDKKCDKKDKKCDKKNKKACKKSKDVKKDKKDKKDKKNKDKKNKDKKQCKKDETKKDDQKSKGKKRNEKRFKKTKN